MLSKLRATVGVAMIWLLTVAGVSATAWFAIDRAGHGLTGGGLSPLSSLSAAATLGTAPRSSPTPAPGPSQPSATSSARASTSGATASPNAASSTSPARVAAHRDRSFSVAGGQVSVRCTGATILLRIAQPDNGWRVEVGASGPEQVAVTFQRGDESPGGETKVGAVCANGAPAITVDTKG